MNLQDLLNRLNRIAMEDPRRLDQDVMLAFDGGFSSSDIGMVMAFEEDTINHHDPHVTIFGD